MSLFLIQQSTFKAKWGHTPVLVPDYSIPCPVHGHCIGKDPLWNTTMSSALNKKAGFWRWPRTTWPNNRSARPFPCIACKPKATLREYTCIGSKLLYKPLRRDRKGRLYMPDPICYCRVRVGKYSSPSKLHATHKRVNTADKQTTLNEIIWIEPRLFFFHSLGAA